MPDDQNDRLHLATTLSDLALLEAEEENLDNALDLLREALHVSEDVGYDYITAQTTRNSWRLAEARSRQRGATR